MRIAYVDGPRFRRSLLAACDYAQRRRVELNRINVFPVPDGDTGTNLALTVQAIADHLGRNRDRAVSDVAREAAEAAILGARGNAGMMLSHFLLGFSNWVAERRRLTCEEFARALRAGVDHLYAALERPVEGTILTVMRDTADAAVRTPVRDFASLVPQLLDTAQDSLDRTPELLPVLKKAGVVDAGAKGFVSLLEGVVHYMNGDPLVELADEFVAGEPAVARIELPEVVERYRFCTEALVRGTDLPETTRVRSKLRSVGDSLIVIRTEDVLKVHMHTDDPEVVFSYLRSFGTLAAHKAEDMRVQHAVLGRSTDGHVSLARRPVSIVTDSACDLPEEVVRAHGIRVVPLMLVADGEVLRDRIDISPEAFVERMRGQETLPTTSQPPPGAFLEAYERAAEYGESIVGVVLGSSLSGTFGSAAAAASRFNGARVHLVDSLGASLIQGLLVMKAAELAELGTPPEQIVEELVRIRGQSGVLFTVDSFERLLASGRVGKGRAWLGTVLGVKPVLGLSPDGKVVPLGKAVGAQRVLPTVMGLLRSSIPSHVERVRFGVAHVGCPEVLDEVSQALRARYGEDVEILTAAATSVVATHVGVGAWEVAFMVED
jgi:DegV family protein with EDD domain